MFINVIQLVNIGSSKFSVNLFGGSSLKEKILHDAQFSKKT